MNTTRTTLALGIAACALQITADTWRRVIPAGEFRGLDGRPADAPSWRLPPDQGMALATALNSRADQIVIDYEHQTLRSQQNGQAAPASGWCQSWQWRDDGLYADIKWTANATAMIDAEEYRYLSPVMTYQPKTGVVQGLLCVALTNTPNLDGLTELAVAALSQLLPPQTTTEETVMDELLEQLRWMLNMPVGATVDEVKAQLQKLIAQLSGGQTATAANSVNLLTLLQQKDQQITALSQQAQDAVDPTKYVPVGVVAALNQQIAALTAQTAAGESDALITAALSDGRLLPAQESWARDAAKKDPAWLKSWLDNAPKIAALTQQQTTATPPVSSPAAPALDESALAVCSQLGLSTDEYMKTLKSIGGTPQ